MVNSNSTHSHLKLSVTPDPNNVLVPISDIHILDIPCTTYTHVTLNPRP